MKEYGAGPRLLRSGLCGVLMAAWMVGAASADIATLKNGMQFEGTLGRSARWAKIR